MDSRLSAFLREARALMLSPSENSLVRNAIIRKLQLIAVGSASELALQPVTIKH